MCSFRTVLFSKVYSLHSHIFVGNYSIGARDQMIWGILCFVCWRVHAYSICRIWSDAIKAAMEGPGKIWIENKRFNSFAPERNHCTASWLVLNMQYTIVFAKMFGQVPYNTKVWWGRTLTNGAHTKLWWTKNFDKSIGGFIRGKVSREKFWWITSHLSNFSKLSTIKLQYTLLCYVCLQLFKRVFTV